MSAAAVGTLVFVALLVGALAFYLIWVIILLGKISGTLGRVRVGVRTIADRTAPVTPIMNDVNAQLEAVADELERLVASARSEQRTATVS